MSPIAPRFLVLQHAACEPPGVYEQVLGRYGALIDRVELDAGEPLPSSPFGYAGVIVMGGPMSVYEQDRHPWLRAELKLIEHAARTDLPVWGVSLGAQLLAAALGANVESGTDLEIGVMSVYGSTASAHDPVFEPASPEFTVLQWHGDTFELPDGAVRLAGSHRYPQQAFRLGNAYGLQFHLEADPATIEDWSELPEYAAGLQRLGDEAALDSMLDAWDAAWPAARVLAQALFSRWLERIAGLPRPG